MPALVQIDGYDPVAAAAVSLRASSVDDDRVCHVDPTNGVFWPVIAQLPELRYDLVDAGFSGRVDTPSSQLALSVEPFPNLPRYQLSDARVRIWTGNAGDAWGSYTLRFDGRCTAQPNIADGRATLTIAVDDRWLDTPLLALYAGTTGVEGDAALKGQPKPLSIGAARFAPGRLIDGTNLVFQLSSFLIEDVEVAFERILRFGASAGDYASYAALVAATIRPGQWATSKAVGMVRHGAPPAPGGRFVYHVRGDKAGPDGWVRLPGSIIKRLALIAGGTGRYSATSLTALDAARPWNISWHITEQMTAREAIQRIAASVNAVAGVSWLSQLFVAPLPSLVGTPGVTLNTDGTTLPPVGKVEQIEMDPPFWRMSIATENTWDVHQYSDIAFQAILVDRGAYVSTETYREGHIVQNQNISWLYTNPTASSGNAPPTLPTASNSYWKSLSATSLATLDATMSTALGNVIDGNVLDRGAKPDLIDAVSALEVRYTQVVARATAQGISTTNAANAKTALVTTLLGALTPAWNDPLQDTPLAVSAFGDFTFPTGWDVSNLSSHSTNGIYETVTDSASGSMGYLTRTATAVAGQTYTAKFIIKKDAVAGATRRPMLRIITFNGTAKNADVTIDTSTGVAVTQGGTPAAYGCVDENDSEWLVYVSMAVPGDSTSIGAYLYPALSAAGSYDPAVTGSVDVRAPVLAKGTFDALGRDALEYRRRAYISELDKLDKAISEADVLAGSATIAGLSDIIIAYDNTGAAKSGELTRNENYKLVKNGSVVGSGLTWTYTVLSGTVNGFDNSAAAQSISGAGAVVFAVSSLGTSDAQVRLKAVDANGVPYVATVRVAKAIDQVSAGGTGGGTSSSASISQSITTTSYGTAACTVRATAGSGGQIVCNAPLSFYQASPTSSSRHAFGKWQWRVIAGTYADITAEIQSTVASAWASPEGFPEESDGYLPCNMTKTGLTNGTQYEFQLLLRNNTASTTLSMTGSASATGS